MAQRQVLVGLHRLDDGWRVPGALAGDPLRVELFGIGIAAPEVRERVRKVAAERTGQQPVDGIGFAGALGGADGDVHEAVPIPGAVLPAGGRQRDAGLLKERDVDEGEDAEAGEDRQRPLLAATAHVRISLETAVRLEVHLVPRDERGQLEQLLLGVELDEGADDAVVHVRRHAGGVHSEDLLIPGGAHGGDLVIDLDLRVHLAHFGDSDVLLPVVLALDAARKPGDFALGGGANGRRPSAAAPADAAGREQRRRRCAAGSANQAPPREGSAESGLPLCPLSACHGVRPLVVTSGPSRLPAAGAAGRRAVARGRRGWCARPGRR